MNLLDRIPGDILPQLQRLGVIRALPALQPRLAVVRRQRRIGHKEVHRRKLRQRGQLRVHAQGNAPADAAGQITDLDSLRAQFDVTAILRRKFQRHLRRPPDAGMQRHWNIRRLTGQPVLQPDPADHLPHRQPCRVFDP